MRELTLIDNLYQLCAVGASAEAIALQSKNIKMSFSQLKSAIESVGGYFNEIGIGKGDRVVLVIENSIDYVVALYAIWKVGGIVVALNPQSKLHEIKDVIKQCSAKCLLIEKTNHEILDALKNLNVILINLKGDSVDGIKCWNDALCCTNYVSNCNLNADDSAQIIYTSGTTGNPKGVLLSHANLMCNTEDIIDYLQLTNKDSVLSVLPFHYSYGNSVLHTHIYVGAKIIMAGSMAFPQDIVNSLRELNVSGFCGVPSTYSLLLSHSDWAQKKLPLRYITQAGGPMNKVLTRKLLGSLNRNTQLFVMYGQTEATARISWLPPDSLEDKMGSVGIALKHVNIEIRNDQEESLRANQSGGVYVSGNSIMQGYWNNDIATRHTLYNGWLKTGDIGYIDSDGYLYLQGRRNDMIKVGSHRVNPLELEEVINKLLFINESAVVGVEDEILGQALCVFVVGDESKKNIYSLKKHCREYLPAHKIPRDIKWVNSLPKTASGKIKRYQLMQTKEVLNDKHYL